LRGYTGIAPRQLSIERACGAHLHRGNLDEFASREGRR
jgi:hypothetical protein